ncbi:hypothetical protein SLS56_005174 [Neofusicoccum ribis]|uniref:Uncharacterized protein n=1 Tax=Neofusicoccum ribis TaxID=45134 RepID=A0ABR3SV29_9PEZI
MKATINGTLIACNLQLTPDILSLFQGGYLSVVDQRGLEEVDLLAASMLFDLSGALQLTEQGESSHTQLPTGELRVDGAEALGPNGADDEASAVGESLHSRAPSLCDENSVTDTPLPCMTPRETTEVSPFLSSGASSYELSATGSDRQLEEIMSPNELEEAWFDFEKYQRSPCTESSRTMSGSPVSHCQSAAGTGTDVDGGTDAENEIAARKGGWFIMMSRTTADLALEHVEPSENNDDDDVVIIDIRPARGAVRTGQDDDVVMLDMRSAQPTPKRGSGAAKKRRRRASRSSVVPYALPPQRIQNDAEQVMANLNRWAAFTGLWMEIYSIAMEAPGLRHATEAMDGYVRLVEDDDWNFQLWRDPLRQHWRKLKARWNELSDEELLDVEVTGKVRRAGRLLKAVLVSC